MHTLQSDSFSYDSRVVLRLANVFSTLYSCFQSTGLPPGVILVSLGIPRLSSSPSIRCVWTASLENYLGERFSGVPHILLVIISQSIIVQRIGACGKQALFASLVGKHRFDSLLGSNHWEMNLGRFSLAFSLKSTCITLVKSKVFI